VATSQQENNLTCIKEESAVFDVWTY